MLYHCPTGVETFFLLLRIQSFGESSTNCTTNIERQIHIQQTTFKTIIVLWLFFFFFAFSKFRLSKISKEKKKYKAMPPFTFFEKKMQLRMHIK